MTLRKTLNDPINIKYCLLHVLLTSPFFFARKFSLVGEDALCINQPASKDKPNTVNCTGHICCAQSIPCHCG